MNKTQLKIKVSKVICEKFLRGWPLLNRPNPKVNDTIEVIYYGSRKHLRNYMHNE